MVPFGWLVLDASPAHLDINTDSNLQHQIDLGKEARLLDLENAPIFASQPQLNLTAKDTFTVSLWLKTEELPSFALIGNNSGSGKKTKGNSCTDGGQGLKILPGMSILQGHQVFGNFSNQVELDPDAWIHLVYIKKGNDFEFYKDGMHSGLDIMNMPNHTQMTQPG